MSRYGLIELHDSYDFNTPIAHREVVMCKECKKHNTYWCHLAFDFVATEDNDFCSYGERLE